MRRPDVLACSDDGPTRQLSEKDMATAAMGNAPFEPIGSGRFNPPAIGVASGRIPLMALTMQPFAALAVWAPAGQDARNCPALHDDAGPREIVSDEAALDPESRTCRVATIHARRSVRARTAKSVPPGGRYAQQRSFFGGNVTIYVSEGTDSLLFVLVDEDQDAVHRGLESSQGPDLAEPALDSVGGPALSAGVLEAGQQIIEIVAQACDGPASSQRLAALRALVRLEPWCGWGGSVEILPDGALSLSRTYLVRPAALDRDAVVRGRQGRQQAPSTQIIRQAASVEIVEETLPFGGALARR